MPATGVVRRLFLLFVAGALALGNTAVVSLGVADAAVVRPFTLNYDKDVYGDFLEAGNGTMRCPDPTDPADPGGEPMANCAVSQAGTPPTSGSGNDAYYMRWSDVDADAASYDSSTGTLTVPPGAKVDFARLNWAGDTGTIRLADGTISAQPGCNTRQFAAGAGTAVLPSGTPESTAVRLTVGGGATTTVPPAVISRDTLANVPASQPQFYSAYADVTASFAGATTGVPLTMAVGNVWAPQGFGCFGGWSLVVVYSYDAPDATYAPAQREVYVYDGHVRQSSADPATTVTVTGFRAATNKVRIGLTGYEGDRNITGDEFSINGTDIAEPLPGGATTNFFVSNAQNPVAPAVVNNMSVDAKEFVTSTIPAGATSANLSFSTSGDTYLAQNLVMSVPVASLHITKELAGKGPFRPGATVPFQITVVSPGGSNATGVGVADPAFADCSRSIGALAPDEPVTYLCSGPAPGDDFTNVATATGQNAFGDPMTDTAQASVVVINPAITITKTADQSSYRAGDTITFTITVHNTGDAALTAVAVADEQTPDCVTTRPTLAAGDSFTYTCTATAPIPGDANTAVVTAIDPLEAVVTATATAQAPTVGLISGYVFGDRDGNGYYGEPAGDTLLAGVTIHLTGTTTGGTPVDSTITTGPDGRWVFDGLRAGDYHVTEVQPPDFDDGIDRPGSGALPEGNDTFHVPLPVGAVSTSNTFAELPTSSLAGRVYEDRDNDGVQDPDEPGLPGVAVHLTGTDSGGHAVALDATTGPDGGYLFPALSPGGYTVTEDQPEGYSDGKDTPGSAGGTATGPDSITGIDLPGRTDATGYLFGEYVYGSIAGTVTDDAGNPIPGVLITLTDADGKPVGDPATTAVDGSYVFTGVVPGTYTVTEAQPAGYGDGPDSVGSAGGTNSGNDVISGIVIGSGAEATGYDFAEDRGSLSGVIYVDTNNNGVQDEGEPGIPGVTVTLTGTTATDDDVTLTTTSGPDGTYTFPDLLGGTYTVTESQPESYLDGKDTAGSADGTVTGPDSITNIALPSGVDATGYLFGELSAGSIAGTVVDDGGNPIPGVTITLTGTTDTGAPVDLTTTTGDDGAYSFTGLRPGTYTVTETQPAGYGDGPDTAGSAGGTAGNDVESDIVLGSGTAATGYDFAEDRGSLSGVTYVDTNNNGVQDEGEPGIPDVTVTLTGTDALGRDVDLTATSGPGGAYTLTDLVGGTYTVAETQPESYLDGKDAAGSSGGTVTGPDSITGVTLDGGADADGYLFGELPAGSLAGTVVDDSGNPIAGVTVTLTGTDDTGAPVERTETTNPDGAYTFGTLRPGTYTVTEMQPSRYGDGPDTAGSAGGTVGNDVISEIVLDPGLNATGYDFTETTSSLSGVVYEDRNDNGVQDPGEPGIGGVTVTLTGECLQHVVVEDLRARAVAVPDERTTTTDAEGNWSFSGLLAGSCAVTETQPPGYADGKDTAGSAGGTATDPDSITGIDLGPGADADGYLFGERGGMITGTVWVDSDGDGAIGPDEPRRLSGVTVVLLDGSGTELRSTTTAEDGTYTFPGVPAGDYRVREEQPGGYGSSTPNEVALTVSAGGGGNADFGDRLGSIGDFVWSDTNGDGLQDRGEPGVEDVTVTLLGAVNPTAATRAAEDGVLATTTTDADGYYLFPDLPAGTYTVRFTAPDGETFTVQGKPGDDVNSDPDRATGTTGPVEIVLDGDAITQVSDVDAGLVDRVVDLSATLSADKPSAHVGDTVTFTGTVTNTGTVAVDGARTTITVPDGLDVAEVGGDGWDCAIDGQTVTCTTDQVLQPGDVATPITLTTTADGPVADTDAVMSVRLGDGTADDNPDNDTSTVTVAVSVLPPPGGNPVPNPPAERPAPTGPGLAWTGADLWPQLGLGALLLFAGVGVVLGARRRRRTG